MYFIVPILICTYAIRVDGPNVPNVSGKAMGVGSYGYFKKK